MSNKKYHIVYKITNILDGKIYVGKHSTNDLKDSYFGSGQRLKDAIKKYGKQNFRKDILYVFKTWQEMNNKEKEIVNEDFVKSCDTYNLTKGGAGPEEFTEKSIAKRRKTWLGKYGVQHPFQTEEVKIRRKQTCLEKYGVEHAFQTEEVKIRRKQTCLEKYGVESTSNLAEVRNKISKKNSSKNTKDKTKNTNLEKYGEKFPMQSETCKTKYIDTNIARYGEEYSKVTASKSKKTLEERYGVSNPSQLEHVRRKKSEHAKDYENQLVKIEGKRKKIAYKVDEVWEAYLTSGLSMSKFEESTSFIPNFKNTKRMFNMYKQPRFSILESER